MLTVGVIFGSRSTEHEVSIASAYAVMQWLKKTGKYKPFPIYIDKNGNWIADESITDLKKLVELRRAGEKNVAEVTLDMTKTGKMVLHRNNGGFFGKKDTVVLDVIFPVLHGKNGEDGSLQGLCEMLNVPYASPSVL